MSTPSSNGGRVSLDNEIVTLDSFKSDGHFVWIAEGKLDGETMRVTLYGEHKRAIDMAGYTVTWGKPQIAVSEDVYVSLVEHNGRRRIASVLKVGTEDEWIEVKQQ